MKTLILSVIVLGGFGSTAPAQIFFEDNSRAAYDTEINYVPNTTQDLNLELLYGTSPSGYFEPAVTLLLSSTQTSANGNQPDPTLTADGDISDFGTISDYSGTEYILGQNSPGQYYGQTLYFEILAWSGNYGSFQAALNSGDPNEALGESQIFSETLPQAADYPPADISNVGVIYLITGEYFAYGPVVPEPSPLAMAGVALGLIAVCLRGERKAMKAGRQSPR